MLNPNSRLFVSRHFEDPLRLCSSSAGIFKFGILLGFRGAPENSGPDRWVDSLRSGSNYCDCVPDGEVRQRLAALPDAENLPGALEALT